jgi:NAD(P)H-dependent FMN reductase
MLNLKIIVGSSRQHRSADLVLPWLLDRAQDFGAFDVDVLDLRDWALPMFDESIRTVGDPRDPIYSDPVVRRWNAEIGQGDAFLFLTPEYNHSLPASLKNAIDSVFFSFGFRNKPASTVAYSMGATGGARAVEHLAEVLIEAEAVPLRNTVLIPKVGQVFDGAGVPADPGTNAALRIALEDLAWWADLLFGARARGALAPAALRATPTTRAGAR